MALPYPAGPCPKNTFLEDTFCSEHILPYLADPGRRRTSRMRIRTLTAALPECGWSSQKRRRRPEK